MNFLDSILKHKNILFAVLFIAILGIIIPQTAFAGWLGCAGGAAGGAVVGSFFPVPVAGTIAGLVIGCIGGAIFGNSIASAVGDQIVFGSGHLLVIISQWFLTTTSTLFESVGSSALLQKPITKDATVIAGWTIVRDFANMFVVLGFIVVGIATILRIREYQAQKTLVPLIIVAILINFSMLFCGIIIDATNITMNYFTQISGPAGITQPITTNIMNPMVLNSLQSITDSGQYASSAIGISLYAFIAAMIFFIYSILLLFRYVALMLLVILSPLGFVCYVFPATHGIYKKWWEQFIQWSIIGIPTAFFIYLAGHIIQNQDPTTGGVLYFWIPAAFLLFAYSLIFQTSAIGASAAIGLATGAAGYAMGATKWAGGKALQGAGAVTGASRVGSAMQTRALQVAERMRLVAPGTAIKPERAAVDTYKKQFAGLNNQQISDNLSKPGVWTRGGVRQRAAMAEMAVDRGAFNPDDARHVAGLKDAQARGFTLTPEHMEKNPRLAALNAGTMEGLTRPVAKGGKGLSQADAEVEAVKQTVEGMSGREAKNKINAKACGDINVVKHFNQAQADEFDKASPKKKANLKKFATAGSAEKAAFDAHRAATTDPVRQAELAAIQARFGTF